MKLTDCIPKHKTDEEAVKRAEAVGYPGINPILPELLIWVQDYNWPVAQDIAPLLAKAGPEIAPHINEVLKSNDPEWKYWILHVVAGSLKKAAWELIEAEVSRLAAAYPDIDVDEDVDPDKKVDLDEEVARRAHELLREHAGSGA